MRGRGRERISDLPERGFWNVLLVENLDRCCVIVGEE